MIYFFHNRHKVVKLTNELGEELVLPSGNSIVAQFFEVAALFPDESILWFREGAIENFKEEKLYSRFEANNYMLSLGNINNHFLYPKIGYVTDGPFVAVSDRNIYPTWLMQETAGMVAASTINQFDSSNYKNQSLEYFLTSVARIGQAQGLLCYHIPSSTGRNKYNKNTESLFRFCLLYTSPSPRDQRGSRMPSSA